MSESEIERGQKKQNRALEGFVWDTLKQLYMKHEYLMKQSS